tara:strand:+ start:325 stop:3924 length:3600 start_codon:yes stop_codon:yes gene_type:complete
MAKSEVLLKIRGQGRGFSTGLRAKAPDFTDVKRIMDVPGRDDGLAIGRSKVSSWFRVHSADEDVTAWDLAHAALKEALNTGSTVEAVEPNLEQAWPFDRASQEGTALDGQTNPCQFDPPDTAGGKMAHPDGGAWHLGPQFTQLAAARDRVGAKAKKVLIAHLDTGFDPDHATVPPNIRADLQHNFIDRNHPKDARDRTPPGNSPFRNPGHGPGTLSILAGAKLPPGAPGWNGFSDYIGAAPHAQIMPVRVANWVVQFTTESLAQGINHARHSEAHVLSMSLGGLSSEILVDAVNAAYDAGVFMVAAAGNSYADRPVPSTIVFPARLKRVLAACGVMANGASYSGLAGGTMQGNFGPSEKMPTAMGAYSPNILWAQMGCPTTVDLNGAGTSSVTPQLAAAAALWMAEHFEALDAYPEPWMRIEAARVALFGSAARRTALMGELETIEKAGNGVLRALDALDIRPPDAAHLRKLPPAQPTWSWLNLLFGGGVTLAPELSRSPAGRKMLTLELTQIAQRIREVDEAIDDPDRPDDQIPSSAKNRYLEAALDYGNPSKPLKAFLETLVGRPGVQGAALADRPVVQREIRAMPVPKRRLRVYALDPSVAQSNDFFEVREATLSVPWDDVPETEEKLRPGPIGEYLEVIDVDPASNKIYEPVDLNDPLLLAQDGWAPSEGNPQFHQQMVYAVGMTTIKHFEEALGRKALWGPHINKDGKAQEVRRLRIYPHALRTSNAYYSPDKKALLFGYFPAESSDSDWTAPGSMVFSCLSSDIIVHEMSHALLDGLHRRFLEASNPDVLAFHEAFADIVALFQHFTLTELVRFEIGRARGDLSAASLLGGIARQFGEGSGRRGALRRYNDPTMAKRYDETIGSHDRGSILVFAVYDAFLKIFERRIQDLLRLATGGSGVLAPGALHPDLVNRLTIEASNTARHMLHMCIRALDYCPAVDITFGEYLRALITADIDVMPEDRLGYRVALMEAFRHRGILPRDVRTVSEESLTWNTFLDPKPGWLGRVLEKVDLAWNREPSRSEQFELDEANRWALWRRLNQEFAKDPELCAQFGLTPGLPRYDENGRPRSSRNRAETTFEVFSVRPTRRNLPDGSVRTELVAVIHQRRPVLLDPDDPTGEWFWFRGGATLLIDPCKGKESVRYSLIKNTNSTAREERQRKTALGQMQSPLRSLYLRGERAAEPFALVHGMGGG